MDERVYMGLAAMISAAIFCFCFYKAAKYINKTKSKKLKAFYVCFIILSAIASISLNEFYIEDYNLYAYFIVKAYSLAAASSIWYVLKTEERTEH